MRDQRKKKRIWIGGVRRFLCGLAAAGLALGFGGHPDAAAFAGMPDVAAVEAESSVTNETMDMEGKAVQSGTVSETTDTAAAADGTDAVTTTAESNTETVTATEQVSTEAAEVVPIEPETEEAPVHAPKVVVSGFTTDPEQVEIGADVSFTVTIRNTSSDMAIYNMKLTWESVSGELLALDAANSRYISLLGAGAQTAVTFSMHVPKELTNRNQKIAINMEYEDEKAVSYSSAEQISVIINLPLIFHADTPIVPSQVESGKTADMSLNLFNTGSVTIYNVTCRLECQGFLDCGSIYVGTLQPASSAEAKISAVAANRCYGALGDTKVDKYGTVNGKIVITYEDEAGTVYTDEVTVHTEITAPADEIEEPKIETVAYSSQWWVSIVIFLILIDILVIFMASNARKHKA